MTKLLTRRTLVTTSAVVFLLIIALLLPATVSVQASHDYLSVGVEYTEVQATPAYEVNDEVVERRGETSKTYYLGDNQYRLISTSTLHYDVEGSWEEINNAWVSATAPWDWQMTEDSYQTFALSDFTAGQILEFEHQGETVAFQPMELQWTNDLNQIQSISMPQAVTATINNTYHERLPGYDTYTGSIFWADGYGAGRHFEWNTTPGRLEKLLTLEAKPPTPAQYIIDGGNPVLRLSLVFDPSSELDIYVDGELWDRKTKKQTFGAIEFRVDGEMLWWFNPAVYWDSSEDEEREQALTTLRRTGGNLWVDVHVPYEWLQTALYPVTIDPTLTIQPPSKDTRLDEYWPTTNYGSSTVLLVRSLDSDRNARSILEFPITWGDGEGEIPLTATITKAEQSLYAYGIWNAEGRTYDSYRLTRTDWVEMEATWYIYKTGEDWTTAGGDYTSKDGSAIVPSSAAWMVWDVTNIVKHAQTNEINPNILIRDSVESQDGTSRLTEFRSKEYTDDTTLHPKLFIEYTEVVDEPDISILPITYDFGSVAAGSTPSTATNYFTITNDSTMETDHTISVTTNTWSGGEGWTHSDTATAGADTAGLLANRGGTWGTGDVIVKYDSPNYIYQNCPIEENYSFGLQLIAPTSFSDGVEKSITVRITAVATP